MRIHNLYTDAGGQSHFRDIKVEWVEERRGSKLSKRLPATGIIFRETQAEHDIDWHPAPRRQYIVNIEVVCGDFSKLVMGCGLAEPGSKLASLCSIGQTHPFVPTCLPAERRAQPRSRLAVGHRRRRRAAVWTAASTVLG